MSETNEEKELQGQAAEEVQEAGEAQQQYQNLNEEELRTLLAEREQQVEELKNEYSEAKDQHLRKAAELENYRKRVQRERAQIFETAKAKALEDFLDINDDLQRTLKAAENLEVNNTFMDGVLLVANKFEEVLKKHGVKRIDEVGVPFNVDLHDAMMRHKAEDDSIGSDEVIEIIENGYRLGDRTIRHAKVIVSE